MLTCKNTMTAPEMSFLCFLPLGKRAWSIPLAQVCGVGGTSPLKAPSHLPASLDEAGFCPSRTCNASLRKRLQEETTGKAGALSCCLELSLLCGREVKPLNFSQPLHPSSSTPHWIVCPRVHPCSPGRAPFFDEMFGAALTRQKGSPTLLLVPFLGPSLL